MSATRLHDSSASTAPAALPTAPVGPLAPVLNTTSTAPPRRDPTVALAKPTETTGVILPFRPRPVRHPGLRELEHAASRAAALLATNVDMAERRFQSLARLGGAWRRSGSAPAQGVSAWIGLVLCHAMRDDWLAADMTAREYLSGLSDDDVAEVYLAAVAVANAWLAPVPRRAAASEPVPGQEEHAVPQRKLKRGATRPAEADTLASADSDVARDYAYALVSAIRFRLGAERPGA